MRVADGCTVSFHFTLSLGDGTRVEGTPLDEPWQIVVGRGELPIGLERCLMGLAVGEQGRFVVSAAEAFGEREEGAREILPRAQFPQDTEIEVGMAFGFHLPDGEEVMGQVVAVSASGVEVDFTHPLAGHDVVFEVDILAIRCP